MDVGDTVNFMEPSKEERLVKKLLSPTTIGELKEVIQYMNDDVLVFRFQWGDIEGMCDWKRKETWKQWVRKQNQKNT